jgi:hypothetical protein
MLLHQIRLPSTSCSLLFPDDHGLLRRIDGVVTRTVHYPLGCDKMQSGRDLRTFRINTSLLGCPISLIFDGEDEGSNFLKKIGKCL